MRLGLLSPNDKRTQSTYELVFRALSDEPALGIADVVEELRRHYSVRLTFQAVRKACGNLAREGVLVRRPDKKYSISERWLLDAKATVDALLTREGVSKRGLTVALRNQSTAVFKAKTFLEADLHWGEILRILAAKSPGAPIISVGRFAWWLILNPGRESALFTTLLEEGHKSTLFLTDNVPLNRWASRLYQSLGLVSAVKPRLLLTEQAINVVGDAVLLVRCSAEAEKFISKLSRLLKSPADISPRDLTVLSGGKFDLEILVVENGTLARSLSAQYGGVF